MIKVKINYILKKEGRGEGEGQRRKIKEKKKEEGRRKKIRNRRRRGNLRMSRGRFPKPLLRMQEVLKLHRL